MFSNGTFDQFALEEFPQSTIPCFQAAFIGWYMCFILAAVCMVNCLLLVTLLGNKELRQPINTFVIAITILNLIGALFEFPFVIGSSFACKWIFRYVGCAFAGYFSYFAGCASIYIMAAISLERFYTIYDPMSIKKITFKNSITGVQICLLFGIFWPTMPLIGWNHYSLEGGMLSCAPTWHEQTMNVFSYNIAMFIFVYIFPLVIIVGTNIKLILILKSMPKMQADSNDPKLMKRLKMERHVTIVMMVYTLIFLGAWTPYAIAALWSAFIDPGHVTPLGATVPSLFAKTAMLWCPMYFIFSNKKVKNSLTFEQSITGSENTSRSKSLASDKMSKIDNSNQI